MRGPILNHLVHDGRDANALQISFDNQPLVMQARERLGRGKIRDPARFVAGQKIDGRVVEPEKAQMKLGDNEVFVVARIADQGPLRESF